KAPRRAVQPGRFGGIQFDQAIIDAQAGEGGQDVLDKADADRLPPECGAAIGAADLCDRGLDPGAGAKVGTHENDPGVRRGRQETQADIGPGQVADALHRGGPTEGPLMAVAYPSHVSVILDCGGTSSTTA